MNNHVENYDDDNDSEQNSLTFDDVFTLHAEMESWELQDFDDMIGGVNSTSL